MVLSFPYAKPPQRGEFIEALPGIKWGCMALPFALDHVNVWLLHHGDSATLVDTSIDNTETRENWHQLLGSHEVSPEQLLITHYHPDHAGLSGWFAREWSMQVLFSEAELSQAKRAWEATDDTVAASATAWYSKNGLDQDRVQALAKAGNTYRPLVSALPDAPQILREGDRFSAGPDDDWCVISAAGHAPEMLCLYSEKLNVLIAADQILPRISPNVSLNWYLEDDNPLHSFLQSLAKFSSLPEDVLVLPSHGLPFRGLHTRIDELRSHHDQRFQGLVDFCRQPRSAAGCLVNLFHRELDAQQLMFGMGESLAHLRFLHRDGRLQKQVINGVDYYCSL